MKSYNREDRARTFVGETIRGASPPRWHRDEPLETLPSVAFTACSLFANAVNQGRIYQRFLGIVPVEPLKLVVN